MAAPNTPLTPEEILKRLQGTGMVVPPSQTSARDNDRVVSDDPGEFPVAPEQRMPVPTEDPPPRRPTVVDGRVRQPDMMHNGNPVYTHDGPTTAPVEWYRENQPGWDNSGRFNRGVRRTVGAVQRDPSTTMPSSVDAPLYRNQEEYEALLPPNVRASMERRRQAGHDVPFDPVPDHVLRVWAAAGPDGPTQAQIQWGYDQRNRGVEQPPEGVPQEGQSQLWKTREEYEALLPGPVRESMGRRRQGGYDVPFRPVPDNVLRAWMAAGDGITQAQIQWGYAQRDKQERGGAGSSGGRRPRFGGAPAGGGNPAGGRNPAGGAAPDAPQGDFAPGHRSGFDGLEDLAKRDDDIGKRARALLEERNQRLNPPPERVPGAGGGKTGAELVEGEGLGDRPDLARLYDERPWLAGGRVDDEQAAANNRAYREYGIRDGTFHPQQEFDLGTAQQQTDWNNFVGSSVDRMNRYRPGVLKPEIDAPGWREVLETERGKANGVLSDENATPEQRAAAEERLVKLDQREGKMRQIELRQREREIMKRYGNAISDETAAELAQAVDAGDVNAVRRIHDDARRNNRLTRERNLSDLQQNRRMGELLNDPRTREGFIYRTMSQGTPAERSALAAALGDDVVYATEMASQAGGGTTTAPADPRDETPASVARRQYNEIRDMVLEQNFDMAYEAAVNQYATYYPNLTPEDHRAAARDRIDGMMIRMTYGTQQPRADFSDKPNVMRRMRREMDEGWDSFLEFAENHGIPERAARQMFDDYGGGGRRDAAPPAAQPPAGTLPNQSAFD